MYTCPCCDGVLEEIEDIEEGDEVGCEDCGAPLKFVGGELVEVEEDEEEEEDEELDEDLEEEDDEEER